MDTSRLVKFKSRGDAWDVGNNVLYKLCKDRPKHNDHREIIAKVWLIGRAYAAAIERRKNKEQENDHFYENTVAPIMVNSAIDDHLVTLGNETEITNQNIKTILKTHKYLTDLFYLMTKFDKRSLASKYLHFHRPELFYIYDSRAVNAIRQIVPRLSIRQCYADADNEYAKFFLKMNFLRKKIHENEGLLLTPRQLDNTLLSYEE